MEKINFEFSKIELKENEHGKNDLIVSMVKLTDKDGKYIKFAKINEELLSALKKSDKVTIKKG